jgi:sarcosine oxidase
MLQGTYDVIVLGVGGMGSATVFELARRGRRVLGLEQFALVHDRGSSHGQSRVIRKAYSDHPAYVALLQRAYQRWFDLEQRQGRHLFSVCGCLTLGPLDGDRVGGVLRSAREHGLPIEQVTAAAVRRRFPAFRIDDDFAGVLEPEAGYLRVEDCVAAYAAEARRLGAELRTQEVVLSWEATGSGVVVRTQWGSFAAERLVICAGAWASRLLAELRLPLTVRRMVLSWHATTDDALFHEKSFPVYRAQTPMGVFYGFPVIDGLGHKVARSDSGSDVRDLAVLERTLSPADEAECRPFLDRYLPAVTGPVRGGRVCMYTMTPDKNFILDRHPAHPNVVIAAGFSGHGFKFASVVGEILADLVESGSSPLPIELFRIGRFLKDSPRSYATPAS